MVKSVLFSILFMVNTIYAFADVWKDPKITITYSDNGKYMLKVYPTKIPQNYFSSKYRKQLKKGIMIDTIKPCYAILYHISNTDTIEIWNKPLLNRTSPVDIFVANDGKSVVTFGEWGGIERECAMVVYGEFGEVIKNFNLTDISPFLLEQYDRSISSIYWRCGAGYVENFKIEIVFCNKNKEEVKRIFNVMDGSFE